MLDELGNAQKVRIGQLRLVQLTVRVRPAQKAHKGRNPATGEDITVAAKPAPVDVRARPLARAKAAIGAEGTSSAGRLNTPAALTPRARRQRRRPIRPLRAFPALLRQSPSPCSSFEGDPAAIQRAIRIVSVRTEASSLASGWTHNNELAWATWLVPPGDAEEERQGAKSPPLDTRLASLAVLKPLRCSDLLCADCTGAGAFSMYPAPSAGGVGCAPGDEQVPRAAWAETRVHARASILSQHGFLTACRQAAAMMFSGCARSAAALPNDDAWHVSREQCWLCGAIARLAAAELGSRELCVAIAMGAGRRRKKEELRRRPTRRGSLTRARTLALTATRSRVVDWVEY